MLNVEFALLVTDAVFLIPLYLLFLHWLRNTFQFRHVWYGSSGASVCSRWPKRHGVAQWLVFLSMDRNFGHGVPRKHAHGPQSRTDFHRWQYNWRRTAHTLSTGSGQGCGGQDSRGASESLLLSTRGDFYGNDASRRIRKYCVYFKFIMSDAERRKQNVNLIYRFVTSHRSKRLLPLFTMWVVSWYWIVLPAERYGVT